MGELFGVPAHPLLVHIPVVLLPLLVVAAMVMAAKPTWRRRFGWVLVGAALVAAAATSWASQAGESLRDALQPALGSKADRHVELANQTEILAWSFFSVAFGLVVLDRWVLPRIAKRTETPSAIVARSAVALACLVAILGVLSAVWVIRTGHEGARITWDGVNVRR